MKPPQYIRTFIGIGLAGLLTVSTCDAQQRRLFRRTTPMSNRDSALAYLDRMGPLAPSTYWPGIDPVLFMTNVRGNVSNPFSLYEGISTNFCSYSALTGLMLRDDPMGYVRAVMDIYTRGRTKVRNVLFLPSPEIRRAAGTLVYKGKMDVRPADQMWFLCLADRFKGYLNVFSRHYSKGAEDALWACVNYAKFNRMVRELLNYRTVSVGSDLIRPYFKSNYEYISGQLKLGHVVMYVNNKDLHLVNHAMVRFAIPTHYIIVEGIEAREDQVTLTYWDYGNKTRMELTRGELHSIVFGITTCVTKSPAP